MTKEKTKKAEAARKLQKEIGFLKKGNQLKSD